MCFCFRTCGLVPSQPVCPHAVWLSDDFPSCRALYSPEPAPVSACSIGLQSRASPMFACGIALMISSYAALLFRLLLWNGKTCWFFYASRFQNLFRFGFPKHGHSAFKY